MTKRRSLLNPFPQHVVPDELSLLSIYEIIAYLLILAGCWYFYSKWNDIPVIRQDISVERLDSLSHSHTCSAISIEQILPVSSIYKETQTRTFIKNPHIIYDREGSIRKKYQYNYEHELDSLRNIYLSHYPDSLDTPKGPLFCIKATSYQSKAQKYFEELTAEDGIIEFAGKKYYQYAHEGTSKKAPHFQWIESFVHIPFINKYFGYSKEIEMRNEALKTPSFFALRDVSQAYYEYRVISHSLDSIYLNISFLGAAEVSPSAVDTYTLSGSRISYNLNTFERAITYRNNKHIENSNEKIIRFHVKYKDMENTQSRRVFLVSSIISGLITVFIAFLIIFIYRLILSIKERRSKFRIDDTPNE